MSSSVYLPPAQNFHLIAFRDVLLLGSKWLEITNDLGQVCGYRACGSACELQVSGNGVFTAHFSIPSGAGVGVTANVITIPIYDEPNVEAE